MSNKAVLIVGSGIVGRQWAMIFAAAEVTVFLHDNILSQLSTAQVAIDNMLNQFKADGTLRGSCKIVSKQLDLINFAPELTLDILNAVELIIECVPENVEIKKKVFEMLDKLVSFDHILASSSSCIGASQFTESLVHRSRCLVAHPVNPPYHLPLVELVPAPWTSEEVILRCRYLLELVGQRPISLSREVPGFAVNRLQYALINQAWSLVQTGILSTNDVEAVVTNGLGPRYALYGPLSVAQLNAPGGFRDYMARYSDGMVRVSADMGQYPDFDEGTIEKVAQDLDKILPIDRLPDEGKRRDNMLGQMAKLKSE